MRACTFVTSGVIGGQGARGGSTPRAGISPSLFVALAACGLAAAAAQAQTLTPIARSAHVFVRAGTSSQNQSPTSLTTGGVQYNLSYPGSPTTSTATAQGDLEAFVFPTWFSVSVAGTMSQGTIPFNGNGAGGNATLSDTWTLSVSATTCFALDYSYNLGLVPNESVNSDYVLFGIDGSGSFTLTDGTHPNGFGTNVFTSGASSFHYEGTLGAGTYLLQIEGEADNNSWPGTGTFHHQLALTLGPPAQIGLLTSALACPSRPVSFFLPASGGGAGGSAAGLAYLWQWRPLGSTNWLTITDGPNADPGTGQPAFTAAGSSLVNVNLSNMVGAPGVIPVGRREVRVLVSNLCGSTTSNTATWTICPADFNCSGAVTAQDIFDFLTAYFAHSPSADFNASGQITVQDLFDFLATFYAGCA